MTNDDLLKQGIAALKGGRKTEAHRLLMRVVQQDESNEMAWLWLSGAVDTDEERRICLEKVLATNPNNGIAQRGLEALRKRRPSLDSTPDIAPPEHVVTMRPSKETETKIKVQPAVEVPLASEREETPEGMSPDAVVQFGRLSELFLEYTQYIGVLVRDAGETPDVLDPQIAMDHELRVRCTSQYLFCRRNYGDDFLALVYRFLMPMLRMIADNCHKGGEIMGNALGALLILGSLVRTRECPELEPIHARLNSAVGAVVG